MGGNPPAKVSLRPPPTLMRLPLASRLSFRSDRGFVLRLNNSNCRA